MSDVKRPAPQPCDSCPYRRDVPSGIWHAEEYRKLIAYDADTSSQPGGLFHCHQTGRGDDRARLCAGWVACHGYELLALRLAIVSGRVDPDVLDYTTTVPIFGTGREAAEHGMREIRRPGVQARDMIDKISHTREDVHP